MTIIGVVPRSCGVHSGEFHADEVTASALLIHFKLIDQDKIVRTRDLSHLASCDFVCDVGGIFDPKKRRFDHHQVAYQGELSSAGMILEYLRDEKIISDIYFNFLNRVLIRGVDDIDNGRLQPIYGLCTFSAVVSSFVPPEHGIMSDAELEEGFFAALEFVLGHLARVEKKFFYMQKCKEKVRSVMEVMQECLIFEKAMPWLEAFFELGGENHPAEFVIMPSGKHWKLRCVPPSFQKQMDVRRPLPLEWAGLLKEDLRKTSGIPGAIFCHKGRFISVWETKEDALKALKMVLDSR
ncbi:MAG: MYG1 family protein [Chlamydiae bacterium]|nr:MYG1 family protein [Chlamydiota bacterium]